MWRSVYWQNYYVSWLRGNVIFFFFLNWLPHDYIVCRLMASPKSEKSCEKCAAFSLFYRTSTQMWHQCRTAESNFIQCPLYEVMQRRYLLLQAWIPPQKNHLQFDDFPSKSQGNWRVVHLSAAERRSGRFYQKGNIFSFCSRPSILVVLFLVLWENIYQYNSSARRVSICSWGGGGGGPRFQLRATDVAVSWLRFFILDFTW